MASGFSYPAPFEFGGQAKKPSSQRSRKPPGRSKSNDESFFDNEHSNAGNRPALPHSKSGRFLPKPNAPRKAMPKNSRGRSPPKTRKAPRQTHSANLEQMSRSSRSSSQPKQRARTPSPESPQPKKPSSLKNFLMSPVRRAPGKTQSSNLEELRDTLHSAPAAPVRNGKTKKSSGRKKRVEDRQSPERSLSPEHRKPNSLKKILTTPMRKTPSRSRSEDLGQLASSLHSAPEPAPKSSRMRSKKKKVQDRAVSPDEKKGKPKSFKQLLGKKSKASSAEKGKASSAEKDVPPPSPVRRAPSPEREPSLSPEQVKKPPSLISNFLDSLYDSYIDPAGGDDDSDDGMDFNSSVSRLDKGLGKFF